MASATMIASLVHLVPAEGPTLLSKSAYRIWPKPTPSLLGHEALNSHESIRIGYMAWLLGDPMFLFLDGTARCLTCVRRSRRVKDARRLVDNKRPKRTLTAWRRLPYAPGSEQQRRCSLNAVRWMLRAPRLTGRSSQQASARTTARASRSGSRKTGQLEVLWRAKGTFPPRGAFCKRHSLKGSMFRSSETPVSWTYAGN